MPPIERVLSQDVPVKPSTDALPDKRALRRQLRAARDSLSPALRHACVQQANVHLTRWDALERREGDRELSAP